MSKDDDRPQEMRIKNPTLSGDCCGIFIASASQGEVRIVDGMINDYANSHGIFIDDSKDREK